MKLRALQEATDDARRWMGISRASRGETVRFRSARITDIGADPGVACAVRVAEIEFVDDHFDRGFTGLYIPTIYTRSTTAEYAACPSDYTPQAGDVVDVARTNDRWWILRLKERGTTTTSTSTSSTTLPPNCVCHTEEDDPPAYAAPAMTFDMGTMGTGAAEGSVCACNGFGGRYCLEYQGFCNWTTYRINADNPHELCPNEDWIFFTVGAGLIANCTTGRTCPAFLNIRFGYGFGGVLPAANYYCADFDCLSGGTFSLTSIVPPWAADCGWPATIVVSATDACTTTTTTSTTTTSTTTTTTTTTSTTTSTTTTTTTTSTTTTTTTTTSTTTTTTTSTTTTSTSTSTTSPCSGLCNWKWCRQDVSGIWLLYSATCPTFGIEGCGCAYPTFSGGESCEEAQSDCAIGGQSTTDVGGDPDPCASCL